MIVAQELSLTNKETNWIKYLQKNIGSHVDWLIEVVAV